MRALRVHGPTDSGRALLCEDPGSGERFTVPIDDRLRAAVRGEGAMIGQLEFDGESQLSPKEIQARIRSGATVEEVAVLAGTSPQRVDRFAYPVLLERSTMAERARLAHPTVDGITGTATVAEAVAATLAARGSDGTVDWDAHKQDGSWVLIAAWSAGRSRNRAEWTFQPGPSGGTLTARNDAAADMVDPALRIMRPLRELKAVGAPEPLPSGRADAAQPTEPAVRRPHRETHESGDSRPARSAAPLTDPRQRTETPSRSSAEPVLSPAAPAGPAGASPTAASPTPAGTRHSRRPAMPSWEDVLLGTRSRES